MIKKIKDYNDLKREEDGDDNESLIIGKKVNQKKRGKKTAMDLEGKSNIFLIISKLCSRRQRRRSKVFRARLGLR